MLYILFSGAKETDSITCSCAEVMCPAIVQSLILHIKIVFDKVEIPGQYQQ
jgi:hypothetical protein